jgi:7-cyano-7-deazaguanine reductase
MKLSARFNVRGGIYTTIVATHHKADWVPQPAVTLP